jgi:hypothetical protein
MGAVEVVIVGELDEHSVEVPLIDDDHVRSGIPPAPRTFGSLGHPALAPLMSRAESLDTAKIRDIPRTIGCQIGCQIGPQVVVWGSFRIRVAS